MIKFDRKLLYNQPHQLVCTHCGSQNYSVVKFGDGNSCINCSVKGSGAKLRRPSLKWRIQNWSKKWMQF